MPYNIRDIKVVAANSAYGRKKERVFRKNRRFRYSMFIFLVYSFLWGLQQIKSRDIVSRLRHFAGRADDPVASTSDGQGAPNNFHSQWKYEIKLIFWLINVLGCVPYFFTVMGSTLF